MTTELLTFNWKWS